MVVSQTSKAVKKKSTADQAFGPKVYVTEEGLVGVTYYDFRNFKAGAPIVATDAWLCEFQLSKDGKSLDLVKESRLTPKSFDSSPSFDNFVVVGE